MPKPWCELPIVIERVSRLAQEQGMTEDEIWTEYYEHRRDEARAFVNRLDPKIAAPWKEVLDNVSFYLETKPWRIGS